MFDRVRQNVIYCCFFVPMPCLSMMWVRLWPWLSFLILELKTPVSKIMFRIGTFPAGSSKLIVGLMLYWVIRIFRGCITQDYGDTLFGLAIEPGCYYTIRDWVTWVERVSKIFWDNKAYYTSTLVPILFIAVLNNLSSCRN